MANNTSGIRFNASLDNLSKVVSGVFPFMILAVVFIQYYNAYDSAVPVYTLLLLSFLFLFGLGFSPRFYEVHAHGVRVHRIIKNVNIHNTDIEHLEILPKEKISNAWRLFGVGGLFGYYGLFYNSQMGHMTFYATRTSSAILILTKKGKKIILTPDNPEEFLASYQNLISA